MVLLGCPSISKSEDTLLQQMQWTILFTNETPCIKFLSASKLAVDAASHKCVTEKPNIAPNP
jgi:hypothetical protein